MYAKHQQNKLSNDEIKSIFKQIRFLLNRVFPAALADSALYKAALKHCDGSKHCGPQEQIKLRDYIITAFISILSLSYTLSLLPRVLDCKFSSESQNVRRAKLYAPKKDIPILFQILIK